MLIYDNIKMLSIKMLYIKRVSSKIRQNFCMFNGPLEAHV